MNTPIKITFMPGCFDSFEGTQEELDQLITEIKAGFETGDIFENAELVELEDLIDELDEDEVEYLNQFSSLEPRKLQ